MPTNADFGVSYQVTVEPIGQFAVVGDVVMPRRIQVRFREGKGGAPDITYDLAVVEGRPQCRSVTVAGTDSGRGVRSADLSINIAQLVEDCFAGWTLTTHIEDGVQLIDVDHTKWQGTRPDRTESTLTGRQVIRSARPKSNSPNSDDFLENVAATYVTGGPAPARAVAERWAVSVRTAGNWIREARDRGFLTVEPPRGALKD